MEDSQKSCGTNESLQSQSIDKAREEKTNEMISTEVNDRTIQQLLGPKGELRPYGVSCNGKT